MTDNYEVKSTKDIQMRSIIEFMKQLGYYDVCSEGFFGTLLNKGMPNISLCSAIKMHNGSYLDNHGRGFRYPFDLIDYYTFKKAMNARIVYTAKLQYCKKKKQIICQDNRVRFIDPFYENLFLD